MTRTLRIYEQTTVISDRVRSGNHCRRDDRGAPSLRRILSCIAQFNTRYDEHGEQMQRDNASRRPSEHPFRVVPRRGAAPLSAAQRG